MAGEPAAAALAGASALLNRGAALLRALNGGSGFGGARIGCGGGPGRHPRLALTAAVVLTPGASTPAERALAAEAAAVVAAAVTCIPPHAMLPPGGRKGGQSGAAVEAATPTPLALIVGGPCGAGKSTAVAQLADRLRAAGGVAIAAVDGDDHHTPAARASITRGAPLDDAYREEWLARVADAAVAAGGGVALVACSALAARHREALRVRLAAAGWAAAFCMLAPPEAELQRRLDGRVGHFAGAALLPSQLATLQLPAAPADEPDVCVFREGVTDADLEAWAVAAAGRAGAALDRV